MLLDLMVLDVFLKIQGPSVGVGGTKLSHTPQQPGPAASAEGNFQSYLCFLRCLRAQSKKRLQQARVHRNEGDEQRRKEVQDSGLEISRLDVEEVSEYLENRQAAVVSAVCHPWNI